MITWDDVCHWYMLEHETPPNWNEMMVWVNLYPQFRAQLVDFTVAWYATEHGWAITPNAMPPDPDALERLVAVGMVKVRELLDMKRAERDAKNLPKGGDAS